MKDFKVRKNLKDNNGNENHSGFLGVKRITKDLKEMPKWFKYFMCCAIVIILFFEFFNTQGTSAGGINHYFEPLARYNQTLQNGSAFGNNKQAAVAVAVLYALNGLSSFTGILAISLICYNKVSQWLWQILNALFFGLMAISVSSLADMLMQVIIILGCPLGWYLFEKNKNNPEKNHSWLYNLLFAIGLAIVVTIVILVLYEFLPGAFNDTFGKIKNSNNPYLGSQEGINKTATRVLDSMTNGFNVTAYIMQVVNIDNQFMLWPFVDVLKIVKYSGATGMMQFSPNLIVEFAVWLSMCLIGTYERLFRGTVLDIFAKFRK